MKNINNYISEKLNIKNIKVHQYKYFPKRKGELQLILRERLSKDNNANLNDIDVSDITDMSNLFEKLNPHNINISNWDVSNVTNMGYMFCYCESFNSDLSKWDVSNVTNMINMFYNCQNFNCDLSEWNVSNVKKNEWYICRLYKI